MSANPPANPIAGVIARLDAVLAAARAQESRLGYFTALYRRVTAAVLAQIDSFDDPARMTAFDVRFAGRYLDALSRFQAGQAPTRAWSVAFRAAQDPQPVVLQHLLLGINAHINLDLGIAAARTAPGAALPALRPDFLKINALLASLVNTVMDELAQVSPLTGLLADVLGKRDDDRIANFSLEGARDFAWDLAETLAPLPFAQQELKIAVLDRLVAGFGRHLWQPDEILRALYRVIRSRETLPPSAVIAALAAPG